MNGTVLYIDDDAQNLKSFEYQFGEQFEVITALSGFAGKKILDSQKVDVIIADQRMPVMTGTEFFEAILDEYPYPTRMILTGYSDLKAVIEGINKGKIYYYLQKPWKEEEITMVLKNAIEASRFTQKTNLLINELESNIKDLKQNVNSIKSILNKKEEQLQNKDDELKRLRELFEEKQSQIEELTDKIQSLQKELKQIQIAKR